MCRTDGIRVDDETEKETVNDDNLDTECFP